MIEIISIIEFEFKLKQLSNINLCIINISVNLNSSLIATGQFRKLSFEKMYSIELKCHIKVIVRIPCFPQELYPQSAPTKQLL